MITAERLRELVHYNPDTGMFTGTENHNMANYVGQPLGVLSHGRRVIYLDNAPYIAAKLAFLYMEGYYPKELVDHKNRIKSDDRWDNLRLATYKENTRNRGLMGSNTSGVPGVGLTREKNWRAYITVNAKQIHLGRFSSFEAAVAARKAAEITHFGAFAPIGV